MSEPFWPNSEPQPGSGQMYFFTVLLLLVLLLVIVVVGVGSCWSEGVGSCSDGAVVVGADGGGDVIGGGCEVVRLVAARIC